MDEKKRVELDVVAISIDEFKLGAKVYLELRDGSRIWAGGIINGIYTPIHHSKEKKDE